jgi:hypothetical protein
MNCTGKILLIAFFILPSFHLWKCSGTALYARPANQEVYGQVPCNERIFMHTDRETYIAGEIMFFKIYLIDGQTGCLSHKSKIAYIILRDVHNRAIIRQNISLSDGTAYGSLLLPDTLQSGLYQVISYTNWMRNFDEANFYYGQLVIANRFDEDPEYAGMSFAGVSPEQPAPDSMTALTVTTDRIFYKTREKVIISLHNPGNSNVDLSVSVAEKTGEKTDFNANSGVLLTCTAGLSGNRSLNTRNYRKCEYLVEDRGYIISGSVINTASPAGTVISLSIPDTSVNLMYSVSNEEGRFFFQLDQRYYNRELYMGIYDPKPGTSPNLKPDDKFAVQSPALVAFTGISDELRQYIRKSQTIVGIQKAYHVQASVDEPATINTTVTGKVYYRPDNLVVTSDYQPMNSLTEIVRETLPYVRLNRNSNEMALEIIDPEKKTLLKQPALFLNGMSVNNFDPIMNFGSEKIRRIETVFHKRAYGSLELNGIMAVFTTMDVKNEEIVSQGTLKQEPVVFLSPSRQESPDYPSVSGKLSRDPDFRQLLYWNPQVIIQGGQDLTIEFYTSDNTGSYVIHIKGLTSNGSKINSNAAIEIQ